MTPIKILSLLLVAGAVSMASCGGSNSSSTTTTTDSTTTLKEKVTAVADTVKAAVTPDPNKSFVDDASSANTKEIAWLQAGIDHGTNKEMKAHAKMMMKDHKGLADAMNAYASKKGIDVPAADTAGIVSINENPGKEWDKEWVDKMVSAHQDAIDKFESAQTKVTDPELKAMIDKTLPTLHSHLDMMKGMQDKMAK